MKGTLWDILQRKYNCYENRKYETLFTLANGYRGLRGSLIFSDEGEKGNFIAGVFDKAQAQVDEIVNCPNPLGLNIYLNGEKINIDKCKVIGFNRHLNMKEGILYSFIEVETKNGQRAAINSERFVSRKNIHRWAEKYCVTAHFDGNIIIESIIDGTVSNSALMPMEMTRHFKTAKLNDLHPGIGLISRTIDEGIEIAEQTILKVENEDNNFLINRVYSEIGEKVREVYKFTVNQEDEYSFYKLGCTYTSEDTGNDVLSECRANLLEFFDEGYKKEKEDHIAEWFKIWGRIDIKIKGDKAAQTGIRSSLFHLSSAAYNGDKCMSIAAKALHGEGYKGHVFWDTETYMLPFFIYTSPDIAKNLLMYRYNTLEGAKKNAALGGFKGARFPWESADDGKEVTPKWGIDYDGNPMRIWTGDEEYHINSDITFAIWEYYRASCDNDFLINYGVELFFETAIFWESKIEYNREMDRYEINNVIGPDEFHEHVRNNAYTNYLAGWSLKKSVELAEQIMRKEPQVYEKLCSKLGLSKSNFKKWSEISKKIYIPTDIYGKLIEQFEGYFNLKDIHITNLDENGMPLWPELDGLKVKDTRLVKQADVVILMILLREEFDDDVRYENYNYYEKRTMHKSSLSPSMYSIAGLAVGDTKNAYRYFMKTIMTDIEDNQGNTGEGFHAASAGGSWQCAVFGFGGFNIDKDMIPNFNPWIPENWRELKFCISWRGTMITVNVKQHEVFVSSSGNVELKIYNKKYNLIKNKKIIVEI